MLQILTYAANVFSQLARCCAHSCPFENMKYLTSSALPFADSAPCKKCHFVSGQKAKSFRTFQNIPNIGRESSCPPIILWHSAKLGAGLDGS